MKGEPFYGRVHAASYGYGRHHSGIVCADDHGWKRITCGMALLESKKGATSMMDCLMVGILLASFGLVWILANWCRRQVDSQE